MPARPAHRDVATTVSRRLLDRANPRNRETPSGVTCTRSSAARPLSAMPVLTTLLRDLPLSWRQRVGAITIEADDGLHVAVRDFPDLCPRG
jgi:hypothetical protein